MKLSKKEFIELVKEEALKIKEEILNEEIESVGDPFEVEMNKNDEVENSDKALAYKDTTKKVEKTGSTEIEVKMNSQDDDQGHDEEIAAAVEVEAGSKKSGDGHIAGQAKGNFTSKTDNPKKEASQPFDDETFDGKMNKEDKLVDEKAKTYVDAGSEKGGSTHTTGQAEANVHERAPEVKDNDPIAAGIEIKGSNIKESYNKTELMNFIKEEAIKLIESEERAQKNISKKKELEEELKKINDELSNF